MRVVLDVNILASATVSAGKLPAIVVDMIIDGLHELIVSDAILSTLEKVLQRPYFASMLSVQVSAEAVHRYRRNATLIDPDPSVVGVADDAEDDAVLGTAVEAQADVIVTGDKGMLAIRTCRGIPIITAREFLVLVNA